MTHLLLIRHGRSTWNAERRVQGVADPPLDDVGEEQARMLAERLRQEQADLVALYSSPLQRAYRTAEIIGAALQVPVEIDERLAEHDAGHLTGLTWPEVIVQHPDLVRQLEEDPQNAAFPGAEDLTTFRAKVAQAFDEIVTRHAPGPVGIVTHGGTLNAYLHHLLGLPNRTLWFSFGNASLSTIHVHPVRPRIDFLNDTSHWQTKLKDVSR